MFERSELSLEILNDVGGLLQANTILRVLFVAHAKLFFQSVDKVVHLTLV